MLEDRTPDGPTPGDTQTDPVRFVTGPITLYLCLQHLNILLVDLEVMFWFYIDSEKREINEPFI